MEPAQGLRPFVVWHVGAVLLVQVLEYCLDSAHEQLWSCVFERIEEAAAERSSAWSRVEQRVLSNLLRVSLKSESLWKT